MSLQTDDLAPLLMVLCFGVLIIAITQLVRIQIEAIGDTRRVSRHEAKRIYDDEYSDGDGAEFRWREMRDFCARAGESSRFTLWCAVAAGSIAAGFASIFLDQALR